MRESLDFLDVTFTYDTLARPLVAGATIRFPLGWTGVVGPNGAGKTTILRLAVGELTPHAGAVVGADTAVYCPQRTDDPPELLDEFLRAADSHACALRGRLGVGDDWRQRWDTLSHGERKRAQIATLLWRQPSVLAVDEPSNHIDADARELLLRELREFTGVGLLVSHDRDMLDSLCRQCLFVDPPNAVMRPGGYTKGYEQMQADEEHARTLRDQARKTVKQLNARMAERRQRAEREHKTRSKRGLAIKDHDARCDINRKRVADGKAGAPLRQLEGRTQQAEARLAGINVKKQVDMSIWLPESRSRRDWLFRLPPGAIPLAAPDASDATPCSRTLETPELAMPSDGRVALTGPNGGGKSTLIRRIVANLNLPPECVLYMPQEISAAEAQQIVREVRGLANQKLGRVLNVVSRLGSEPRRLLETETPSPGETRKLQLALGVASAAQLVIMDEPTNHLDLPSIRCLEDALAECPCGLLLVSHDYRFLRRLTRERWIIERSTDDDCSRLRIARGWETQA